MTAAPDAELDRLLSEYGRAHARAVECLSWPDDTPQYRAAIHAHVERMKLEARGEVVEEMAFVHKNSEEKFARIFPDMGAQLTLPDGWYPVSIVRRPEKEEE